MSTLHIFDRPFDPQRFVGDLVFGVTIRIDDGPETGAMNATMDRQFPFGAQWQPDFQMKVHRLTTSVDVSGILAGPTAPAALEGVTEVVRHGHSGETMTFPGMRCLRKPDWRVEPLRPANQYDQHRWGTWSLPSCVNLLDFYAEATADGIWTDSTVRDKAIAPA